MTVLPALCVQGLCSAELCFMQELRVGVGQNADPLNREFLGFCWIRQNHSPGQLGKYCLPFVQGSSREPQS